MITQSFSPLRAEAVKPATKRTITFDIEIYSNYSLFAFMDVETEKVTTFQISPSTELDRPGLLYTLQNNTTVGFNSFGYDLPLTLLALDGASAWKLKCASDRIINENLRLGEFYEEYGLEWPRFDHIDLQEVAPGKTSLKMYAGRLHAPRMEDLPIEPDATIDAATAKKLKEYNVNDLKNTAILYRELLEPLKLREQLSKEYGMDLRSKSDAQIAEAVICSEVEKLTGTKPTRPQGLEGTQYHYNVPGYIRYESPALKQLLEDIRNAWFVLRDTKGFHTPPTLENRKIKIGYGLYTMGLGGLHSNEKCVQYQADDEYILEDNDVASYYPRAILSQRLAPEHIGEAFLTVYNGIVDRRLAAKAAGIKVVAESLKTVIVGSFGKFGSKWSRLYAPQLMIQTTLTGQLAILMLIERIESAGIEVISANTDGFLTKCPRRLHWLMRCLIAVWELETGFVMEATLYKSIYTANVNNYIAVKKNGKTKLKGLFANPWSDPAASRERLMKNPQTTVCIEAALNLLTKGTPIRETIMACKDSRKFVSVRKSKFGATKDGVYLGKAIRFYYAMDSQGAIRQRKVKAKVPKSDNAKPLMDLPETLPNDVNYKWYVAETQAILCDIGFGQATLF